MIVGKRLANLFIENRKGPAITIDCGDLPNVPEWAEREAELIVERLRAETPETQSQATTRPVPAISNGQKNGELSGWLVMAPNVWWLIYFLTCAAKRGAYVIGIGTKGDWFEVSYLHHEQIRYEDFAKHGHNSCVDWKEMIETIKAQEAADGTRDF